MSLRIDSPPHSMLAASIYGILNPVPYGCFVAALIFDVIYANTGVILWGKSAAWLIVFGLLAAVLPRLINLSVVWISSRRAASAAARLDFWLNLLGIAAAIINAFVHSRDAYAVVPAGVWLSALTVLLLSVGQVVLATAHVGSHGHE